MKKVFVMGGGMQGRVVAQELAKHHQVIVGDMNLVIDPAFDTVVIDAEEPDTYRAIMEQVDLVVGCLPSSAGIGPVEEAARLGVDFVDLSFTDRSLKFLNPLAQHTGATILHDCGLAPGLPNMIVGRELRKNGGNHLDFATILVGGVSKDPNMPYGYVNSWSLPCLKEEYTRVAKYVEDGKIRTQHPLYTPPITLSVNGKTMEAFYSDGLRSMLEMRDRIPHITELTLRWPGHMAKVHELMDESRLVEEFTAKCSTGQDVVVLRVTLPDRNYDMTVEGDQLTGGISAMSKTTAFTCAAVAESVLNGYYHKPGVHPPEEFGEDKLAFNFVIDYLRDRNIVIDAT